MFTDASTQDESADVFGGSTEETTPSDSSPENVDTAQDAGQEVETPPKDLKGDLHKDTRFKRVIEERNELRRKLAERDAKPAETRNDESKQRPSASKPAWFAKYFGDDDEAWQGFQEMTASSKEAAKKEALAEWESKSKAEKQEGEKWNAWVERQHSDLEDEGEEFDRNKLNKVMADFRPTGADGQLDFRKGLQILRQQFQPKDGSERRKLADALNGKAKGDAPSNARKVVTPRDLRRMEAMGEI